MMIFRVTVRVKLERAFLVLVTMSTIVFLAVMVTKFTRVPATTVEAEEVKVETVPVVVMSARVVEEPVVEVTYAHSIEEPIAGFALTSTVDISEAYNYTQDLYLLAKLIHCEAGIDNMAGKLAVGTVVMNRVEHWNENLYGGPTLKGVIYHKLDDGAVHQFSCVDNEALWSEEPGDDDYEAARKVLDGYRSFNNSYLYYYNPTICSGIYGVTCDIKIGKHVFGTLSE
jgi:N-acetylmuramoyl-L-alanine amidase